MDTAMGRSDVPSLSHILCISRPGGISTGSRLSSITSDKSLAKMLQEDPERGQPIRGHGDPRAL